MSLQFQVLETDKHNALVVRAANVIEQLVSGLGSNYAAYAERTLSACLNKAKGTNQHIVQALRSTSRAVLQTVSLDTALRPILAAIGSPATGTQIEATGLLAHCLVLHNPSTKQGAELNSSQRVRVVKPLLTTLSKLSQHRTPECRDASFQAFAATRLFLDMSPSNFASFTDGLLDDQRRLKVDVAYDMLKSKAETMCTNSKRDVQASLDFTDDLEPQQSKKKGKRTEKSKKNRIPIELTDEPPSSGTRSRRPLAERNQEASETTSKSTGGGGINVPGTRKQISKPAPKRGRPLNSDAYEVLSWGDLCDRLSEYLNNMDLDQLKSTNWKTRLEIMQTLKKNVLIQSPSGQQIKWLMHFVIQSDRLKDINFQVRNTALDIILALIPSNKKTISSTLDDHLVGLLCQHVIPSLGEVKSTPSAKQILTRLASCLPVTGHLLSAFQGSVKPPLLVGIIEWLTENTLNLALSFDLQELAVVLKSAFASNNPSVRSSAIRFAARVHVASGSDGQLRRLLADEKPALLARLDEELTVAESEAAQRSSSSTCRRESCRLSDARSSCSSSSAAGSGQPKRVDVTILKGDAPLVNRLLAEGSASDDDDEMNWSETTPM
ncbi:unnamed protein product [Echinostoma caproni]|uniref:TOG domain-containing protein n=1 Tax=Echinostoma caproni TaxID=27848 RepID=A0A183AT52_9TREM|nr:unnamed protein product [Echinostoma caproni]